MFESAMSDDVDRLAALLEKEDSLVRCECHYRTPLHFAIRENQIEAARFLLDRGAAVPYSKGTGITERAEQMALDRGNLDMHKLLTNHQFERFGICDKGEQVVQAIRDGSADVSKPLIKEHGVHVAGLRGNKPLHWAVMTRQMELIKFCLDQGADINAVRPDGARPLDLTNGDYYYRGWRETHPDGEPDHWQVMEFLLSQTAEYDLTTACRRGDMDRAREIITSDPDAANRDALYSTWYSGFPLRSAAKAGHIEIVRLLLKHGADPNKPEHGLAPFGGSVYDATQNGHYDVVKLLLENGANPNQEVESSGCPLSQADEKTTKLLREYGAVFDVYGACYWGHADELRRRFEMDPTAAKDSSIFEVAAAHHRECAEVFLEHEPNLFERMPATLGSTPEQTAWLIESGMRVNNTDWLGVHKLHRRCSLEQLTQWVTLGVDVNLIDSEQQSTPLGHAARRGKVELAKALIEAGADPNLAGADWAKPIEWAKRRGHAEIVELLTN